MGCLRNLCAGEAQTAAGQSLVEVARKLDSTLIAFEHASSVVKAAEIEVVPEFSY
jgi:hypothetical protein